MTGSNVYIIMVLLSILDASLIVARIGQRRCFNLQNFIQNWCLRLFAILNENEKEITPCTTMIGQRIG
jgi:hypothetical protein